MLSFWIILFKLLLIPQPDGELASNKSAFSLKFNTTIWILTTGLQFVVGWWYRRSAVFYLPPGWLGPLAWWLAFPFAPKGWRLFEVELNEAEDRYLLTGSVSVGVWQMACRRVIKLGERVVKDFASELKIHFQYLSWVQFFSVLDPSSPMSETDPVVEEEKPSARETKNS